MQTTNVQESTTCWVVHAPYPNGNWRGLQHCKHVAGRLLLCASLDEALAWTDAHYTVPCSVQLAHPVVGTPFAGGVGP